MIEELTTWTRLLTATSWLTVRRAVTRLRPTSDRDPAARHPDDGYTSEAVIVTALLVAAAITIIAIIVAKVTARANAIPM